LILTKFACIVKKMPVSRIPARADTKSTKYSYFLLFIFCIHHCVVAARKGPKLPWCKKKKNKKDDSDKGEDKGGESKDGSQKSGDSSDSRERSDDRSRSDSDDSGSDSSS